MLGNKIFKSLLIITLCCIALPVLAESIQSDYDIYGGTLRHIRTIQVNENETQVYVTTESPNTLYQATIDHSGDAPVIGDFTSVNGMEEEDNNGIPYYGFEAYFNGTQTCLYLGINNGVVYGDNTSGTFTELIDNSTAMSLYSPIVISSDGQIYFLHQTATELNLHSGNINDDCSVTFDPVIDTNLTDGAETDLDDLDLVLGPKPGDPTSYLYILDKRNDPVIIARSSDPTSSLTTATTFADTLDTTSGTASVSYDSMAVISDGTIWMVGADSANDQYTYMQSTSDFINWNETNTGTAAVTGDVRVTNDTLIYGRGARSIDNGATWSAVCSTSEVSHHSWGDVVTDPNDATLVYLMNDSGLGVSTDSGAICTDSNDGIQAVQIRDIFVNQETDGTYEAESVAWLASKSGIRNTTNFNEASPTWGDPIYPNDDSAIYYSVASDPEDLKRTYVANSRIYRTTDMGATWTQILEESIYEGYLGANINTRIAALEKDNYYTLNHVIYAGLNQTVDGLGYAGGLFVTSDDGTNWRQVPLANAATNQDAAVEDILITQESGSTVVYAAAWYVEAGGLGPANESFGIYKFTPNYSVDAGSWTAEVLLTTKVNIYDLAEDANGVIWAVGNDSLDDAGDPGNAVIYNNASGSFAAVDTTEVSSGVKVVVAGDMPDGTCNGEIPYVSSDRNIYYLGMDDDCEDYDSSWTEFHEFASGNDINTMFWDELVVGTNTGFSGITSIAEPTNLKVKNRTVRTASLRWSGDNDYYKVQVRTKKGAKVKTYTNVSNTKKQFKKKLSKSNQGYKFRVKACDSDDNCSSYTNYKSFRTLPAKPKRLRIKNITANSALVRIKKPRGTISKYSIKVKKGKTVVKSLVIKKKMERTWKNKMVTGLNSSTKYTVRVKAIYNSKNKSAWKKKRFTTL